MTDNMTLEDGWDMGQQWIAITVCFRKMPPALMLMLEQFL